MWEAIKALLSLAVLMVLAGLGYMVAAGIHSWPEALHSWPEAIVTGMMSIGILAMVQSKNRDAAIEKWAETGSADAGQMSNTRRAFDVFFTCLIALFFGFAAVTTQHRGTLPILGIGYGLYIFALFYGMLWVSDRDRIFGKVRLDEIIAKPLKILKQSLDSFESIDERYRQWVNRQGDANGAAVAGNHRELRNWNHRASCFTNLSKIATSLDVVSRLLALPNANDVSEANRNAAANYAQRAVSAFEAAAAYDRQSIEESQRIVESIRQRFGGGDANRNG